MKTADVIAHFKTQTAAADAIKVRAQAVGGWKEYPPPEQQMRLQKASNGKLKAEPEVVAFYRELCKGLI